MHWALGKETSSARARARAVLPRENVATRGGGHEHDDCSGSGTRPRHGARAHGSPRSTLAVLLDRFEQQVNVAGPLRTRSVDPVTGMISDGFASLICIV